MENILNLSPTLPNLALFKVEKSSSTTAIESPTRRNSGIKYLNQLEEQHEHIVVSTTPVAIASEEKVCTVVYLLYCTVLYILYFTVLYTVLY